MAVLDKELAEQWAIYNGDCMEVMPSLPAGSIHLSVYSPPFAGLYHYTSSERDLSNSRDYPEFLTHYGFVVSEIARVTKPGRVTAVHCTDIPTGNSGHDALMDFPGDLIRLHREHGFGYIARYHVWKEPFAVRMRTLAKGLAHQTVIEDATRCSVASADYLLIFRKEGASEPVEHPTGLMAYAGARPVPSDLLRYRGWKGKQTENKYSQWVWRQYASAFWDDVRVSRVLPFLDARDDEDEKHVHPLQLDVIERAVTLWSNPGERVLTPFMGVGSEVYGAVRLGRKGIGIELKPTYYRQAVKNLRSIEAGESEQASMMFDATEEITVEAGLL